MKEKLLSVAIVLAVLTIISPVFAVDINAFTASPDGLWTNAANWAFGVPAVPNALDIPWARLQSDNVTVDAHVAETTYRTQVGYANGAATLTILAGGSLTNSDQLQVGSVSRTSRNGVTSTMTIYGDYIGTSNQAINVGLVNNTAEYTGGFHNGVLNVDGGTVDISGGVLNVANYGTTSVGDTIYTNDAQGTVIIQNGATVAANKMEINSNSGIGAGANNDSITINDSTFNLVGGYELISQLDGQFYATNSTLKLGDTLVSRNSSGFAIVNTGAAKDLELAELRINTDGAVISNVNLTGLATLEVGNNSDTTASLLLNFAGSVTNESIDGNADGDSDDNLDQRGGLKVAASARVTGVLDFDAGEIVMVANALRTNDLLIGAGNGSEGTLNLGDNATLKGTVGDFKLGGGNAKAADLVNSLTILGDQLWTGTDMVVTNSNGSFANLTDVRVGFMQNSSGTLAISNSSGIVLGDMNVIQVGDGNGSTAGLVVEGGTLALNVTNTLRVGMGLGSAVTAMPTLSGVIGSLDIGEGVSDAMADAILSGGAEMFGNLTLNTTTLRITTNSNLSIYNFYIGDDTVGSHAAYTNTAAGDQQQLTMNNLYVNDIADSTGELFMSGGTMTITNVATIGRGQRGIGRVVVTDGAINATGDIRLGDQNQNTRGEMSISGGTVSTLADIEIGSNLNGTGVVTMTGGTLSAGNEIDVGLAGDLGGNGSVGFLTANDATITAGDLKAAPQQHTKGYAYLTNNTVTIGDVLGSGLGHNSHGEIYVSGGTLTAGSGFNDNLVIATGTNSYGLMDIKAAVQGGAQFIVNSVNVGTGTNSTGFLTLHNVGLTNDNITVIGNQLGSMGTVNLSNTVWLMNGAQDLLAAQHVNVGNNGGTGILNVDGGSIFSSEIEGAGGGDLRVGVSTAVGSSTGTLNIAGGSVVNVGDVLQIGYGNVAANRIGVGTLNITNATLNVEHLQVGQTTALAQGTMNIQEGATVNVGTTLDGNGYFSLGNASNTTSVVNMSGGTVNMQDTGAANLRLGINGEGTFNLIGGTVNATNMDVTIGHNNNGNGTLNLGGGLFNAGTKQLLVGYSSNSVGSVNVFAAGALAANNLTLGRSANGVGNLTATGGTITLANQLAVGASGTGAATIKDSAVVNTEIIQVGTTVNSGGGTLNIEGGTVNVGTTVAGNGFIRMGNASNTTAVVNMSGGTLNMQDTSGTANLQLGYLGEAMLNLSGGQINATNQTVQIGVLNGGNGTLNISGNGIFNMGTKTMTVGNNSNSVGNVNVYGGMLVANIVHVGFNADGIGFFAVTGGVVNIANAMNVGTVGTGALTIAGGSVSVGSLALGSGSSVGTATLSGGSLLVNGAITSGNPTSSYINIIGDTASLTWNGKTEADFIALWNAGTLRRNGQSGLAVATFSDYFSVSDDVLTPLPASFVVALGSPVAVPGGTGLILTWDSETGKNYDVEFRNDLVTDSWQAYTNAFGVYTNMAGTGGGITVTAVVEEVTQSYRVTEE